MRQAIVLQHVEHEGPGSLAPLLAERGVSVQVRKLSSGDEVPAPRELEDAACLVIMGGPMGVGDLDDERYPFLAAEVALLQHALAQDTPVLGICLGAQLLAHALGAEVGPNRMGTPPLHVRELGFGAVSFHHDQDPAQILGGLGAAHMMVHWHGDAFALPEGAHCLASTLHCANQMFVRGMTIGMQFHPELDEATIEAMTSADRDYLLAANGPDAIGRLRRDRQRFMRDYQRDGSRLLAGVLRFLLSA
jgi:GMP synthase (glutamine-hydrolysing)